MENASFRRGVEREFLGVAEQIKSSHGGCMV